MDDTRTAAIVDEIVTGLREVIRRHRVTYAEYRSALRFLAETVEQGELPLLSDVLFEAVVDEVAQIDSEGTDTNVEGPFYIADAPMLDADGGTPVLPMRPEEPGDRLLFTGAVRSTARAALSSAMIDIWQANGDGLYSRFAPDLPEWNLRGRIHCDTDGDFRPRTLRHSSASAHRPGPQPPREGAPSPGPYPCQSSRPEPPGPHHPGLLRRGSVAGPRCGRCRQTIASGGTPESNRHRQSWIRLPIRFRAHPRARRSSIP
jgi:hypothetical protein